MNVLSSAAGFLLSQWLWSVTWGWYHIPINIIILCALLNCIARMSIIPAVLLTLLAHVYSFIILTGVVVGGIMYGMGYSYDPGMPIVVADPWHACLYLAVIYAVLQCSFFMLAHRWSVFSRPRVLLVTVIANLLAAYCVYNILPNPLM